MSQDKEVEQKCLLNSLFNSEVFKIKRHVKYINCHHFSVFFYFFFPQRKSTNYKHWENHSKTSRIISEKYHSKRFFKGDCKKLVRSSSVTRASLELRAQTLESR